MITHVIKSYYIYPTFLSGTMEDLILNNKRENATKLISISHNCGNLCHNFWSHFVYLSLNSDDDANGGADYDDVVC